MSWKEFEAELRAKLTDEDARFVRRLRVDQKQTWRGVAELFGDANDDRFEEDLIGNQGLGMYLCELAAERLGEDPSKPPWN